jgi:hypothetical protein
MTKKNKKAPPANHFDPLRLKCLRANRNAALESSDSRQDARSQGES